MADEVELGLRVAVALEQFWVISDPWEGARRFDMLLAQADHVDPLLRARALRCAGGSNHVAGNLEKSRRVTEESLALFRSCGDEAGEAILLHRLAVTELAKGGTENVRELLEQSRELFRRAGIDHGEAEIVGTFGYLAQAEGKIEQAAELYAESAALAEKTGFDWWRRNMLISLAEALLQLGRVEEGEQHARASLSLAASLDDRRGMFFGLVLLSWAAAVRRDAARAGRLWGAAQAEEERSPIAQWEPEREIFTQRVLVVDGPEFARAREEGRGVSLERAVEEALAG